MTGIQITQEKDVDMSLKTSIPFPFHTHYTTLLLSLRVKSLPLTIVKKLLE